MAMLQIHCKLLVFNLFTSFENYSISHSVIAKVKAELDQFIEGLHTFDFLSLVKADPETWKIFFVYAENRLTPGESYMHNI